MCRLIAIMVVGATLMPAAPAAGGGSWLETLDESYQPGDEVTAVGYVGAAAAEVTDDFVARLDLASLTGTGPSSAPVWHPLGPVTIESSGLGGYLSSRVSISFTLPDGLEPGEYYVAVTDESGNHFGDLIGLVIFVGVDPPKPQWIEWPLDEPLISELSDGAVIAGPGFAVEVSDLRQDRYPPGAKNFMLDPEALDRPGPAPLADEDRRVDVNAAEPSATPVAPAPIRPPAAPGDGVGDPTPIEERPSPTWWVVGSLLSVSGAVVALLWLPRGRSGAHDGRAAEEDHEDRVLVSR